MTAMTDPWWMDPSLPWWAKHDRATQHIGAFKEALDAYMEQPGFEVMPDCEEPATEIVYRFRVHREVPVEFSTMLGDVLHNLRSALDCVAYVLAEKNTPNMTPEQQRHVQFPICDTTERFDEFFRHKHRQGVLSADQKHALRWQQPGHFHDHGVLQGDDPEDPVARAQDVRKSGLRLLDTLNNIDKHRHLHLIFWQPELTWWWSEDSTWLPAAGPYRDRSEIGRLVSKSGAAISPGAQTSIELMVEGDVYPRGVLRLLESLSEVTSSVIVSVFTDSKA